MSYRVGIGYDVHRMVRGRPLILGGVSIEHTHGLLGHSDADVLSHAITDAVLGAAALGDIGHHFPDTDEVWKNADSIILLHRVMELVDAAGYAIVNVDATVVLERPKLKPHIADMRKKIAQALRTDMRNVSVKATTNERMGLVGREEGAAAWAVCMLEAK